MLELVNISNANCDIENLLHNKTAALSEFLQHYGLDGIEFMLCAPWDQAMYPEAYIKGVHLMFWPSWLDFWREDETALLAEFATKENICAYYGSLKVADWIASWKKNLQQAASCQPQYVVFHVAHNLTSEMYTREFAHTDEEVIEGTIELVNEIKDAIPKGCRFLFENLWWPGLTFQKPSLAARLLERVCYTDTGFMLDIGHLMNTNLALTSEKEGAQYIRKIYQNLGEVAKHIYGIHLHQSLSGSYTRRIMNEHKGEHQRLSWQEAVDYVLQVDRHQPFQTNAARCIVELIRPEYLVHEFVQRSRADWEKKLQTQQKALQS